MHIKRKLLITALTMVLGFMWADYASAQVTSNKGTDFWIGYMGHIDEAGSNMKLYVTSDVSTTGTVSIPGQNWSQNYSVIAGSVTVLNIPPDTAYVGCSDCIQSKGIRLVATDPVVLYSHIHANARSDATLVLPTATLGREYYCMSNDQHSFGTTRNSQFMVLATEDSTTIEITPKVVELNNLRSANQLFTIVLNKGQVYQYKSNSDITGAHVKSVPGTSGKCKRVAVFSGSSFTSLGCSGSGDNLYQQMYPISAWGKEFITIPFKTRTGGDEFRVMASDDFTQVFVNGVFQKNLNKGEHYEFLSATPNYIRATKPVKTAQFQRTQACGGLGDPSMTILSPIEQQLNDITLYSSPFQNILNQHINVVMKRSDTASFRLDNNRVIWSLVPSNPNYVYTQTTVASGNHTLSADSGFNAVAYGFGSVESYGYAAGANIRNLTHFVSTSTVAVCKGEPTTFIPNTNYVPDEYKWYLNDTFYSDSIRPVITFDTLGTFSMALVTINNNQNDCASQDSSTISITVRQQPQAKFTIPHVCLSDTINYLDSSTIEGNTSTINKWRWEFGDGTANPNKNVFKHYDSSYIYDVSLIVTTNHGCVDTLTQKVPVYPMPQSGFSFSNVCYNDTAYFTDTSTIDSTVIKDYIWQFGDLQADTNKHPDHLYATADTFTVKQKAISDMGCADSTYQDIVIYPRPIAYISTGNECLNDTVVLKDSTIFTTDYSIVRQWWEFVNYIDSNKTQKWLPADTGLHTISLWVVNNFGCSDTAEAIVDIYSNPKAAFDVSDICFIDTANFINKSTSEEDSIVQWLWSFGDGGGSFLKDPLKIYGIPANYSPRLAITTDKGCTDDVTGNIDVFDMPDVKFDINDVCVYDTAFFTDFSDIRYGTQTARLWQLGDGKTDTATSPEHKYAALGSYNVKLRVEVSNLCVDSGEKTITIYPRPRAGFTFINDCVRKTIDFTDTSTVNFGSITRQEWDLSNRNDTGKNVTSIYFTEGQKTIQLVASSQFGCKDTTYKTLTIYPEPKVSFTANEVCLRDTTAFIDSVTITSGYITNYNWDYNDVFTDTGRNPIHTYRNWGDYSVELSAVSDRSCINSFRRAVRVNPLPVASIFTPDVDACEPFEVFFTSTSSVAEGGVFQWFWRFGDNFISDEANPIHTYQKHGTYTPYLKVASDKGCEHDSSFANYINVFQLPVADFETSPKNVSFFNPEINFTNTSSNDVINWDWSFGDGQVSGSENNKIVYGDTGSYVVELIVRNSNWCRANIIKNVFIRPDYTFYIPNAFSPNTGDLNPTFGPEGIFKGLIEYKMEIFSRWGEKVFETTDLTKKWDGRFKDKPAAPGVYIYKISTMDYFNNRKHHSGSLLLIR